MSLRVRVGQGQWIALHGETITGPDGQAQGISVVIGPARPGTVLPILAAAYGLTGREQEVIRDVFAGHSTSPPPGAYPTSLGYRRDGDPASLGSERGGRESGTWPATGQQRRRSPASSSSCR